MPYIEQEKREEILENKVASTRGELNFLITTMCNNYIRANGLNYSTLEEVIEVLVVFGDALCYGDMIKGGPEISIVLTKSEQIGLFSQIKEICSRMNTQTIHPSCIRGTLECVKLEFYRRAVMPYETIKTRENGDLEWPTQSLIVTNQN